MDNEKMQQAEFVPESVIVQVEVTPAEGGCLLRVGGGGPKGPLPTKSRVVEGDPTSDAFRRKVQRTIVRWMKGVYFTAPPRAKKGETAETPEPATASA